MRERAKIAARVVLAVVVFLGAAAAVAGYYAAAYYAGRPWQGFRQPVFVDIEPGTPTGVIATRLRSAGVLRGEWPFRIFRYLRPGSTLKAGEYYFDRPFSPLQVLDKLRRGDVYHHTLRVIEGANIFEVAEAVGRSGLATSEQMAEAAGSPALIADFDPAATSLEGYLFPDTYLFPRRTTAAKMAAAMVARYRAVYGQLEQRHKPSRTRREIVAMASLVEKETGVPEERPVVAGVFYNRLARHILLQCDPTVVYAALLAGRYRGEIYRSDLGYNSPYNTYLNRGLPPGPIANPGRGSLEAAMAPATTDYLFFVKGEGGGHRFSRSLAEHNRAVAEYRRLERARARQAPSGRSGQ